MNDIARPQVTRRVKLRVKDLDFANQALIFRSSEVGKDRIVMLPQSLPSLIWPNL
jgi:hypothetical protein